MKKNLIIDLNDKLIDIKNILQYLNSKKDVNKEIFIKAFHSTRLENINEIEKGLIIPSHEFYVSKIKKICEYLQFSEKETIKRINMHKYKTELNNLFFSIDKEQNCRYNLHPFGSATISCIFQDTSEHDKLLINKYLKPYIITAKIPWKIIEPSDQQDIIQQLTMKNNASAFSINTNIRIIRNLPPEYIINYEIIKSD